MGHKRSRFERPALLLAALILSLWNTIPAGAAGRFVLCHYGQPNAACVVDGDTIWIGGEKIRAEEFDAPEMGPPRCRGPARLASAARASLLALLNDGGALTIERHGVDRYGRTLARLSVGGEAVGAALIARGLARPYVPGERPWC